MKYWISRLISLEPERRNQYIMVRILRAWNIESKLIPGKFNSMEMVVLDSEV